MCDAGPPRIFRVLTFIAFITAFIPCFDSTRHACFAGFFLKLRCKKYDSRGIHNGSWGYVLSEDERFFQDS
jgi:hypothetical protein